MTAARPAIGSPCRSSGGRAVTLFTYGRMKLLQRISDAGSIPASSTTTGLHGFDGMNSRNGRPAMVPAASGSAKESGVRCDGPIHQTPTTAFITWRRLRDDPAARIGTKGRHHFNGPDVKPETNASAHSIARHVGTTVCESGFGATFFNGRNAGADRIGERVAVGEGSHVSYALICATTHAGTTRRIKREIDARPSSTFPDSARGPGVAAFESTAAAPVFHVMVPA